MRKCSKRLSRLFFTMVVAHMPFYVVSHMTVSLAAEPPQAGSSKESAYQEIERGGRLYVFASSERKAEFEKSKDIGKGIIKIGYGPDGKTVVFDSDEAVKEYNNRHSKPIVTHLGSQDKAEK